MADDKGLRIIELQASNVKRLVAVSIKPDGNVVVIKGANGAGKSSVLDSLMYAFAGKGSLPPETIRRGQEKASITVDLGDIIVERKFTAETEHMKGSTSLEVRSKEGAKFPSPQALLDKLVGELSFDPMAFLRLPAKQQAETLRQLVGIDLTALDAKRAALYGTRTDVNRQGQELRARHDAMASPVEGQLPDELVSVAALVEEQKKLHAIKEANDRVRAEVVLGQRKLEVARARVRADETLAERLQRELDAARAQLVGSMTEVDRCEKVVANDAAAAAQLVDPDLDGVTFRILQSETTNAGVRAKQERAKLAEQLETKRAEKKKLDAEIEAVDVEKATQLAAAKFPVADLGFNAEGLTLKDLPLEQASSAERLRVSLAMGLALNPKLKVVLIRDGSLLDEKSLQLVAEMAAAAGGQVWVERVSDSAGVGITIEEGQVKL